jgi:phosphopantothenoylcysteine decarboxylase/phosphopantothenate--cysteine ligase
MREKTVLLIIGGGIAAYKVLELARLLKKRGIALRIILTRAGAQFVTPLSLSTLAGEEVHGELFDLDRENRISHVELARDADLIVVAPATADLLAKMAHGLAGDLATACLLAARSPVLVAPAMNAAMWKAPATRRNCRLLRGDGVHFAGPAKGDLACGESGEGRMVEPSELLSHIERLLESEEQGRLLLENNLTPALADQPLSGRHVLVTAGPTHEPIDPVRYIANHSSGRQGYAIARAARELGARVTLISGPVNIEPPQGVELVRVGTAREMLAAVRKALPADIAVCAAAVADWHVALPARQKLKKKAGQGAPKIELARNPDILATISAPSPRRPCLVIGFAAETEDLLENARAKLAAKGCDWIVANDVSPASGTFGGENNEIILLRGEKEIDAWPPLSKEQVARALMFEAARAL